MIRAKFMIGALNRGALTRNACGMTKINTSSSA